MFKSEHKILSSKFGTKKCEASTLWYFQRKINYFLTEIWNVLMANDNCGPSLSVSLGNHLVETFVCSNGTGKSQWSKI